jgi:hypothetical protein
MNFPNVAEFAQFDLVLPQGELNVRLRPDSAYPPHTISFVNEYFMNCIGLNNACVHFEVALSQPIRLGYHIILVVPNRDGVDGELWADQTKL